jgi:hypothetical protein
MPRGRRRNLDQRIASLIRDLKAALVAREQQRIEGSVAKNVDALVAGLRVGGTAANGTTAARSSASALESAPSSGGNRKARSAAFREAARKRMVAYWAAKKRGKGAKAKKPAAAKGARRTSSRPSPGRLRQIAAMKAFWRKKKAEKGEAAPVAAK